MLFIKKILNLNNFILIAILLIFILLAINEFIIQKNINPPKFDEKFNNFVWAVAWTIPSPLKDKRANI